MKKRETLSRWLIAPLLLGLLWTSCAKEEVAVLDVPTSAEQVVPTKVEQSLLMMTMMGDMLGYWMVSKCLGVR